MRLETHFNTPPGGGWHVSEIGRGRVAWAPGALRLTLGTTAGDVYSDAQLATYTGRDFACRPPLRMRVAAHAEPGAADLRGTAGFGFWNHPFVPGQTRIPRLPQAVWFFFASLPNDMRLARGVPGAGWKAATFDARRRGFLALVPTLPIGVLLMRIPALYDRLWPVGQRAIGVSEHLLDSTLLAESHTYTLDWRRDGAIFAVDGVAVHRAPYAPRGTLGFIAWIDNQYAVVTPQGKFGVGLLPVEREQALILEHVALGRL